VDLEGTGRRLGVVSNGLAQRSGLRASMDTQFAGNLQRTFRPHAPTLVVDHPEAISGRVRFASLGGHAPVVVPSMLLWDFGQLDAEVQRLESAGARSFHLDVMDGVFVPNLTYGVPIVEAVRRATRLPIEVHLMIVEPARYAEKFVAAGADAVTFHVEAEQDPAGLLRRLRSIGAVAGLAYNPGTPLAAIEPYLADCDLVLTMSVHPGFGGQSFEPVALEKIQDLGRRVSDRVLLEVDGGVNDTTIGRCAEAGAHLMVVGSAIFSHPDYAERVATLTRLATTHARTP
jgi:ribulose-phosphate 3-epimerase